MKGAGRSVEALSPGKLILAGEHAVVYGRPALVSAISWYAHCRAEASTDGRPRLEAPGIGYSGTVSWDELGSAADQAAARLEDFRSGRLPAGQLMQRPEELPWYAVALAWREVGSPREGVHLRLTSDIPTGSGCGSSAAVAAAVIGAIAGFWGMALERQRLFELVWEAERLRHGTPSGVDPAATVFGGLLRYVGGRHEPLPGTSRRFVLLFTGTPAASTAECVEAVRRRWRDSEIWDEFEQVVDALEAALMQANEAAVRDAVRENHCLLCRIGVVPARVQALIREIEERGGAAKVCGAGSVRGDAAGMVWVVGADGLRELAAVYGCRLMEGEVDEKGFASR